MAPGSIAYVLDDDKEICVLMSRMLKTAGLVAVSFTEPDICLKQLKAVDEYGTPGLFVLDLSLGGSDGIEVLNQLKMLNYKGRVLLVSGKDESALSEIERMGASRGLVMLPPLKKPFQLADLTNRLKMQVEAIKPAARASLVAPPTAAFDRTVSGGTLVCRYQARFSIETGSVCGAEMVLYEQPLSKEALSISSVLPNAPVLVPLSRKLIRTAVADWSRHLSGGAPPIRICMKLPLAVVTAPGFIVLLREVLSSHLKAPSLLIHVTDWHLFENKRLIRETSAQLKLYNVSLSIDNIGAVYSALTESYKFPFEEFRLSSNFTSNCAVNEDKRALCRDTIKLAHSVGASVCADGVLNGDELETLATMKCNTAQGYALGAPQSIEAFAMSLVDPSSRKAAPDDGSSFEWPSLATSGNG